MRKIITEKMLEDYKTSSINSFLIGMNLGLKHLNCKKVFLPENRELSKSEYMKLVKTAMNNGKVRLGMIIQTICATVIRVSGLSSITIPSVKKCDIGISNIERKCGKSNINMARNKKL